MDVSRIESWHAHVYFDAGTRDTAWALREEITARFADEMVMGRFHERPVGPHPRWSYQVAFKPDKFERIVPWLNLNRRGLTVLVHPNTGEDLEDHRDRAAWLGESVALDLAALAPLTA
ncbi:MAG: DOPA 4,5-dioxygenase family protein [Rhodospirillales bacterium]|nr:MAG: DOPA 4,5-dioxygenase family protein [Rhodospirillales bacterium]